MSIRRILVRDLVRPCRIGVGAAERATPQPVRIGVELVVEEDRPVDDRELASVVDYTPLLRTIEAAVQEPVHLVEALAERIGQGCFFDDRIRLARIRVEKTALLDGGAVVGIEIERRSPQQPSKDAR